jgi:hypothetical protein
LLPLQPGEKVVKLLTARELEGRYLVMLTKNGIIKRTDATEFSKIRSTGIRCTTLREGDELVFCKLSSGSDTIIIATAHGQGIRFKEDEVRSMGRQAAGVIGIRTRRNDYVVGMEIITGEAGDILFATENGYGKKVSFEDFRVAHRGGVGVRTIPADRRNGQVIGLTIVHPDSNILLIDQAGKIIRLPASEVRTMGRQAKGVRLVRLDSDQKLASIFAFREGTDAKGDDGEGIKGAVKSEISESDRGVRRSVAPEGVSDEAVFQEAEFDDMAALNEQEPEEVLQNLDSSDDDTVFEFEQVVQEAKKIAFSAAKKEDKKDQQKSVFESGDEDIFEGF